ncbi:MAG: hypothetical protein FD159_2041 [Syntrophaceae bacterium]|nr:MAG: hypothetical protein FD159_2041 [Syntrophaceae bacterium]
MENRGRQRPEPRRDCDNRDNDVCYLLHLVASRRQRPEPRRDCDIDKTGKAAFDKAVDAKDLNHEGIATIPYRFIVIFHSPGGRQRPEPRRDCDITIICLFILSPFLDAKDLNHEGIATLCKVDHITQTPQPLDAKDLNHEGIATPEASLYRKALRETPKT